MKIKTGDTVQILAGKDKGKTGKVMQVFPPIKKVVIEGLNLATKHLKGNGQQPGKKIQFPAPMNISNVALVGKDGKSGRVGYEIAEQDGKKTRVRILRKAGKQQSV
ncbi:50S ribosomal protein L24 [Candidatus Uhrbacteria bacterium CG10_big_fil_rev_8_21_14_0_10_50_16]|uniref:Large ribosomal subunit protein uL24 n=1 Tax=Candidatus Uhrbacteria bacterium CG10_big_fil_rev_8_21_14_0_10_50_16 TaxID=1975039 RepID=A0A2H0RM68_9BACT|nr:MAG: 50S ribosomal protein L24 [Candidatus Uhrbacteria bacterium CG10_big_fil_rev_8_21_14_0_10_50_16]